MSIFRRRPARTECIGCGSTAIRYLWINPDTIGGPDAVEYCAVCASCQAEQQCAVTIRFTRDMGLPPHFAELIVRGHLSKLARIADRRAASARNRVFRPATSPEPICMHRVVTR